MTGLIFAAGLGTRLKPWTESHPKALVPVGGRPMLGRVIDKLTQLGVSRIIVNTHHFAQQVRDYIESHKWEAEIIISDESDLLLDTGGGLRKILGSVDTWPLIIHNADVLTNVDLGEMTARHTASRAAATLLTDPRQTARMLVFSPDMRLCGWTNRTTGETRPKPLSVGPDHTLRAFDGVHILSSEVVGTLEAYAPAGKPFSITDFYIDCCSCLDIRGYDLPAGAQWYDVGRPESLEKAQKSTIA